jgi:hypothetical protein
MAGFYINDYRPWPGWVVEANEEIARKFNTQIGTYRGHADGDPGHDMSGDLAADFFLYDNTKAKHDAVLAWFKTNAKRLGATYIITWRRIWSVARAAEGVRVYTGPDPHTGHIHISYGTKPPDKKEEEDMPTVKEIWDAPLPAPRRPDIDNPTWQADSYVRFIAEKELSIEAKVKALDAKLDAILAAVKPPTP